MDLDQGVDRNSDAWSRANDKLIGDDDRLAEVVQDASVDDPSSIEDLAALRVKLYKANNALNRLFKGDDMDVILSNRFDRQALRDLLAASKEAFDKVDAAASEWVDDNH